MLLLEVDAFTQEQIESEYNSIVQICLDGGALDAFVGDTPAKMKKMWHPRQMASEAFKARTVHQSGEDLVVPMGAIPDFMLELERLAAQYNVLTPCFGHAGDGNMHVHVIKQADMSIETWDALLPQFLNDLYHVTAGLGGTLSGEHGVGSKRTQYLPIVLEPETIALQRRIKQAFDPLNILNPGKIFPQTA
jgi:glycolate oxidase